MFNTQEKNKSDTWNTTQFVDDVTQFPPAIGVSPGTVKPRALWGP